MNKKILIAFGIIALYMLSLVAFASAVVVDSEYVTFYAGDEQKIKLNIENNENYDIEDVSIALELSNVPFSAVGSSEKDAEDINENDDDDVSFTLKASTDIVPGDYDIPYIVKYRNDETDEWENKSGSFGVRVSAETNIDFSVESKGENTDSAIVGQKGKISLRIINQGLGEVKFVSVQVNPIGYELTSANKIYIGSIDSDDSDTATFDVIFKSASPTMSATINYKDFDNKDQIETISLPVKVYTYEKALELGIVKKPNYTTYIIVAVVLIVWFIWRRISKARKKKKRNGGK